MWMRGTEQHYVRRRARSLSQMVLLSWRVAMQHEQLSVLAHDVFQLRADLEEAEMQITEIHDPARTQVNRDSHIQCKKDEQKNLHCAPKISRGRECVRRIRV